MFILFFLVGAPSWIDHPPVSRETISMMGEGESGSKEEALQKAWNSALIRIGISEFPELNQLSSKSIETLKESEFERTSIQNFQLISWKGIHEIKSFNSPFISFDPATKTYRVYRLLTWSKRDLEEARREVSESLAKVKRGEAVPTYKVPMESEELQRVKKVNQVLESRNEKVKAVLLHLRCGTTINEVWHLLGKPDRHRYLQDDWGTYRVYYNRDEGDEPVYRIGAELGGGEDFYVCH